MKTKDQDFDLSFEFDSSKIVKKDTTDSDLINKLQLTSSMFGVLNEDEFFTLD